MRGQSVRSEKYGRGTILSERNRGFSLLVQFKDGSMRWMQRREVNLVEIPAKAAELDFTIGDFVEHSSFGMGEVLHVEDLELEKDYKITVLFGDSKKTLRQSAAKLSRYLGTIETKVIVPQEPFIPVPEESKELQARRIIESLRLGIVPQQNVEDFTVGRDNEIDRIKEYLNDTRQHGMLLVGDYGSGKTHLIQYAINRALHDGLAVARVSVDSRENPFHKPKRVYSELIRNFAYPSRRTSRVENFRMFLEEANSQGAFVGHEYLGMLDNLSDPSLLDWIQARESIPRPVSMQFAQGYGTNEYGYLPPLYDYSNTANIYCNLLSGLGWICRTKLDLKGLLLVFDESESFERGFYGYQNRKSLNFIESLCRTARNDISMLKPPAESGLEYCNRSRGADVPFLYRIPSGMKIVFALTNMDIAYVLPLLSEWPVLQLSGLSIDLAKDVLRNVDRYYHLAYKGTDHHPNGKALDLVNERLHQIPGGSRRLMKACVEALDILRFDDQRPIQHQE